ncbi:MAG TPA: TonB-dependent receptor [Gammaproteobacteria bacterium]|nr:TonB-dependent receptor [Gammaproteobacteria bacterium]
MNTLNTSVSFRLSRLSLAIALVSFGHLVTAEETRLGPIAVEAQAESAEPLTTSTVDADTVQFLRPATSDTASLLRDVPGVSLYGAGGVSSLPAIRGLADDRLRIKVDGMDLIASCPNHMNPPLSYIDPSNVGTLKVFAGITPVSVGGDSIGGTIIADSVAPEFAAPGEQALTKGEVGAFYRSNNNAFGGNLSAMHATEAFNINYSGSHSQADNYTAGGDFKTTTATGRVGHTLSLDEVGSTAYETQTHNLGMALKAGSDVFEAQLGYQNVPEQLYPNQRMDMLDNIQKRINLSWLGGFDWGDLETRVYHETVEHFMDFGPDKRFWYGPNSQPPATAEVGTPCAPIGFMTCASGMPMYSEGKTTGATVKADIDITPQDVLRVGGEYQRYRLDDYWTPSGGGMWPDTFLNINNGERDRAAVFAEWESQLNPEWLTLLGVRYERVKTDAGDVQGYKSTLPAPGNQIAEAAAFNARDREKNDDNVDLTALVRYSHDANLDVEFGFARKVRSPNLYERYTWSTWAMPAAMNNFVGDGNGYVGNIDLEPEKAHTVSATFDWHAADRHWELKATPYYTHVDDYIDAIALPGWAPNQFNVLQYANQSARLYGIDLSGQMPLARNDWGSWGLKGLVNYTDGENRDSGEALYNIMPLNARFTLTQEIGGWSNGVELVVVDDKDDVSGVRNEVETSGYTLVNLRGSHSWKQVRVDFGVENLFDTFYSLPTGGAYTGQGTTMQLNGIPWGIAVPGMGRSFYAGVNVSF